MSAEGLERDLPHLAGSGYQITSDPSTVPNCIAWAMGDREHSWEPVLTGFHGVYDWPPDVRRDDSMDAWTEVFALFGYQECADSNLEPGHEKLAIYADAAGAPQHVARQLPSGAWTSKLGQLEDIEHPALEAISGGEYGIVVRVLRRPLTKA